MFPFIFCKLKTENCKTKLLSDKMNVTEAVMDTQQEGI